MWESMDDGHGAHAGDEAVATRPEEAAPAPRPIERTLADQLQLHHIEIERRKELLGFTRADAEVLAAARGPILELLDAVVDEFYAHQTAIEEIALIIGDAETLRRLRTAQREYIKDLFSGTYDGDYVNNRLRIGQVHKRLGVEPKYYLSAIKASRTSCAPRSSAASRTRRRCRPRWRRWTSCCTSTRRWCSTPTSAAC